MNINYSPFIITQYDASTKAMTFDNDPGSDFWYQKPETLDVASMFGAVPWFRRAVELRANGMAGVPFRIMQGDEELDTSAKWENKLE